MVVNLWFPKQVVDDVIAGGLVLPRSISQARLCSTGKTTDRRTEWLRVVETAGANCIGVADQVKKILGTGGARGTFSADNHPDDMLTMYIDTKGWEVRYTEDSNRLWE